MMQVSSIAHTFLSKWFVPLERTPSSLRLALRPVMVLLLTHLLKDATSQGLGRLQVNANRYYRRVAVKNLM
jgi:hypothetical protein